MTSSIESLARDMVKVAIDKELAQVREKIDKQRLQELAPLQAKIDELRSTLEQLHSTISDQNKSMSKRMAKLEGRVQGLKESLKSTEPMFNNNNTFKH